MQKIRSSISSFFYLATILFVVKSEDSMSDDFHKATILFVVKPEDSMSDDFLFLRLGNLDQFLKQHDDFIQ